MPHSSDSAEVLPNSIISPAYLGTFSEAGPIATCSKVPVFVGIALPKTLRSMTLLKRSGSEGHEFTG